MYNENNSTSHTSETDSEGGTRTTEEETTNKEVILQMKMEQVFRQHRLS